MLQYFISTHGARKGLADTALKTANSGYLTRRLVDVTQDLVVTEDDCGTTNGVADEGLDRGRRSGRGVARAHPRPRARPRTSMHPESGRPVVHAGGTLLDEDEVGEHRERWASTKCKVRTPLTLRHRATACAPSAMGAISGRGQLVNVGEAVGVIAAQSIGEPGTQLTMRTFHIGGAASRTAVVSQLESKSNGTVRFSPQMRYVTNPRGEPVAISRSGEAHHRGRQRPRARTPQGAVRRDAGGDATATQVKAGKILADLGSAYPADHHRVCRPHQVRERRGRRDRREADRRGHRLVHSGGHRPEAPRHATAKGLRPSVKLIDDKGKEVKIPGTELPVNITFQIHSIITVKDGQQVQVGEVLARIPQETSKTRDITGGLPRVAEAVRGALAQGRRHAGGESPARCRSARTPRASSAWSSPIWTASPHEYLIPKDKHVMAHDGQVVNKGEMIVDGPADPHDILRLLGVEALARYITDEVQDVYRLQGVKINDKHIEVIVRQMLRRVQIADAGDTQVHPGRAGRARPRCWRRTKRLGEGGKKPATYDYMLLGITKASLSTDSFISAASFQETTRVLTEAAIMGKRDDLRGLEGERHRRPADPGRDRAGVPQHPPQAAGGRGCRPPRPTWWKQPMPDSSAPDEQVGLSDYCAAAHPAEQGSAGSFGAGTAAPSRPFCLTPCVGP